MIGVNSFNEKYLMDYKSVVSQLHG
jgi:hypothetical protein